MNNTVNRIINEEINKLIKENFATSQPEKFWDKIESLGFEHRLTKSEYEGSYNVNNRQYFLPQRLCNDKAIRRLERLCNVYGMRIYKRTGGQDFYGNEGMTFHIETEHQQQARYQPTILYHATPIEKVDKILRMGLSPRDEGKRGEFRGNRIYLAQTYDAELFHSLFAPKTFLDDYKEYRVLKVNLDKIKEEQRPTLYDDNLAPGCFYTTDSIPPQALTLLRDKHNADKQTYQEIIDKFCKKHNLQYHVDRSCVIGNPFSKFTRGLLINGTINKDGNTTITLTANIQDISIGNEPNEDKWEVDIKLKLENNKLKRPKYKKSLGNKITGNADKIIRFIESMTGEK